MTEATSGVATPQAVREFWFQELSAKDWFKGGDAVDEKVRTRFAPTYDAVSNALPINWLANPLDTLAAVIVLDQFPRNLFRGSARSFESDAIALTVTKMAVARGDLEALDAAERDFLLMPLQHSEVLQDQELSIELFTRHSDAGTLEFAKKHRDIIAQFGRFPHRNEMLGRGSTAEEEKFLAGPSLFW